MSPKYVIAANCFLTKGAVNSILADPQNDKLYSLSFDILDYIGDSLSDKILTPKEIGIIDTLLKEKILIEPNSEIIYSELDFETPCHINNCIIVYSENNMMFMKKMALELDDLLCKHLEIRMEEFNCQIISKMLTYFQYSFIESIDLYSKYVCFDENELIEIKKKFPRLRFVLLFEAPKILSNLEYLCFTEESWFSNLCCGVIEPFYFVNNITLFSEFRNYNSCLYKKISIDKYGDIKNCPSMITSFANIKDNSLRDVFGFPEFQKIWVLHKDKIHVCKDCEFRYICTDCRAYVEDPSDILSKPLKCGYNPYTGEWSEWSTNPLKQKAIQYYGMEELVAEKASKMKTETPGESVI